MEMQISTRNIKLNPESESYIQKKIDRLERHLGGQGDARLEISRTSSRSQDERFKVQMTIKTNAATLRGQESGLNLFAAIDSVTDVLDRQIQRYKGKAYNSAQAKRIARTQAASPAPEDMVEDTEDINEDFVTEFGKVVRSKRFPMKPMTVEEAIMEMEFLSHSFFLFHNSETDGYNVVYQRQDGDYGVIEPTSS